MTDKIEIRIDRDLKDRAIKAATEREITLSEAIRCLLRLWIDCDSPDLTMPAPGTLPTAQQLDRLFRSVAEVAFELNRVAYQIEHNPLSGISDSLLQSIDLNSNSLQDQVLSRNLPGLAPDNQNVPNDEPTNLCTGQC